MWIYVDCSSCGSGWVHFAERFASKVFLSRFTAPAEAIPSLAQPRPIQPLYIQSQLPRCAIRTFCNQKSEPQRDAQLETEDIRKHSKTFFPAQSWGWAWGLVVFYSSRDISRVQDPARTKANSVALSHSLIFFVLHQCSTRQLLVGFRNIQGHGTQPVLQKSTQLLGSSTLSSAVSVKSSSNIPRKRHNKKPEIGIEAIQWKTAQYSQKSTGLSLSTGYMCLW